MLAESTNQRNGQTNLGRPHGEKPDGRPVRVCFLIDTLRLGGTETHLLRLIEGLNRHRVIPHLCLLDGAREDSKRLEPQNCEVHRLGVTRLLQPRTIPRLVEFSRLLRRWKIDVLQVFFPDSTYFGVPAARLAGVKTVVRTRRDLFYWVTPMHRRFGKHLDGLFNRFSVDAMLVNSQAVAEAAQASERPTVRRIILVENGIDQERFIGIPPLTSRSKGGRITVGMVAMLRPEKRPDLLVDAAIRMTREFPDLEFRLAGDGPMRKGLAEKIRAANVTERVRLLGPVDNVPQFLSTIDIAVLCSDTEGQSNALVEYMAAGRAIVATNVGGNAELIESRVNGMLVPRGDSEALSRSIEELARDASLRCSLGAAAKLMALDRFAFPRMLEQYERSFVELARRRK